MLCEPRAACSVKVGSGCCQQGLPGRTGEATLMENFKNKLDKIREFFFFFFSPRAGNNPLWSYLSSEVDSVNGKQVTLLGFSLLPATTLHYGQLKIHESVFSTIMFT